MKYRLVSPKRLIVLLVVTAVMLAGASTTVVRAQTVCTPSHVVAPGENLFRIALRYGVTLDALMRANGIVNPNLIFVGQVLRIP